MFKTLRNIQYIAKAEAFTQGLSVRRWDKCLLTQLQTRKKSHKCITLISVNTTTNNISFPIFPRSKTKPKLLFLPAFKPKPKPKPTLKPQLSLMTGPPTLALKATPGLV